MNPLTNTRNITKLSERELKFNDGKTSWHDEYRESAWIFIGGLPYDLTEGDVLAVFSQYGEIVNLNLCRDKLTGKSKGFGFICFEDQRSTILTVDNLNAVKLLGRTIRVDHVKDYKPPKDSDKLDDITRTLMSQGCAPDVAMSGIYDAAPPSDEELLPYEQQPPQQLLLQIKNEPCDSKASININTTKVKTEVSSGSMKKLNKVSKKSKKIKKKEKKSKKGKKRRKHKKKSSSSSESSSDSDSSSSSDSRDGRKKGRR